MKLEKIDLGETGNFSPIFLDYLKEEEKLKNGDLSAWWLIQVILYLYMILIAALQIVNVHV